MVDTGVALVGTHLILDNCGFGRCRHGAVGHPLSTSDIWDAGYPWWYPLEIKQNISMVHFWSKFTSSVNSDRDTELAAHIWLAYLIFWKLFISRRGKEIGDETWKDINAEQFHFTFYFGQNQ
jgi:hypothetical protein